MPQPGLARRLSVLEQKMGNLEPLPDGVAALEGRLGSTELHFLQSREEAKGEFFAIRQEMRAQGEELRQEMKAQGEQLRREMQALGGELRQEMEALGGELRQEMEALGEELRQEIKAQGQAFDQRLAVLEHTVREGDAETRRYMLVLYEDLVSRIKTISKG